MNEVIPLKEQKYERDHRNIYDDLSMKLGDIYTVADLLGEVDTDNIGPEQLNATGYCLTRLIREAQKLSEEHLELWREEIAQYQKD